MPNAIDYLHFLKTKTRKCLKEVILVFIFKISEGEMANLRKRHFCVNCFKLSQGIQFSIPFGCQTSFRNTH